MVPIGPLVHIVFRPPPTRPRAATSTPASGATPIRRQHLMTLRLMLFGFLALAVLSLPAESQVPPDQHADMIVTSARKAHNEANYAVAIQRYNEFLQKFGNHAQANTARYQLALAYLESPERNYDKALENLGP